MSGEEDKDTTNKIGGLEDTPKMNNIETKKYELKLNKDVYIIIMELHSNETIHFKANPQNKSITLANYENTFNYEELVKKLIINREIYNNISKVFKLYDVYILKKKVSLVFSEKEKIMKLSLRKLVEIDEIECVLDLKEVKTSNDEKLDFAFNAIKEMKIKNDSLNNEICEMEKNINILIEDNKKKDKFIEEMKNEMQLLIKRDKKNNQEIEEMKNEIKLIREENKNKKEVEDKKELFNYLKPPDLRSSYVLVSQKESSSLVIEVFTGLLDNIPYLVYGYNNGTIKINRIMDNINVNASNIHQAEIKTIKYFKKNEKEDFLLSIDKTALIIIWEIQNNYFAKYIIKNENQNDIDSSLFF